MEPDQKDPQQQPSWEGPILAMALIFTALLGISFSLANAFRWDVPWFVLLIISVAIGVALRYRSTHRS